MNTTIEDAIRAWIVSSSGLQNVIWGKQSGPRPASPYISIDIESVIAVGQGWLDTEILSPGSPGADVTYYGRGQRIAVVVIQVFAETALGTDGAAAILNDIISKARLPSIKNALSVAGIGIASFSPIKTLGEILNTVVFEPRATVDVRIHLKSEVSEVGTRIGTVEITGTTSNGVINTTVDAATDYEIAAESGSLVVTGTDATITVS